MTNTLITPVRYDSDVEQILEDEQELIDRIGEMMTGMQETVEKKEGAAMRATHAEATGLLKGELIVAEDLPAEPRSHAEVPD